MAKFVERRKQDRRKGAIRTGKDRRANAPPPSGSTRSGIERRKRDRRSGMDRRKAS